MQSEELVNFIQQQLKVLDSSKIESCSRNIITHTVISVFAWTKKAEIQLFKNCQNNLEKVLDAIRQFIKVAQIPVERLLSEDFKADDDTTQKLKRKGTFDFTAQLPDQQTNREKELLEKIKQRDLVIQEMTVGYLKDVQHLREMAVRKRTAPDEDCFDVTYYDLTKSLEPVMRDFIRGKILEVQDSFRQQISKLRQDLANKDQEMIQYRSMVEKFLGGNDVLQMVKGMLFLENDIYVIYKALQDVIGNDKIFEVFEKRKASSGIDYKQIDSLIAQSQASHRIYEQYKEMLDYQYVGLTKQLGKEIQLLRDERDNLKNTIEDMKNEKETDYIQLKQNIKLNAQSMFEIKEQTLKDQYRADLNSINEILEDKQIFRKCVIKHALYKWLYLARCTKQKPIRKSKSTECITIKGVKEAAFSIREVYLEKQFEQEVEYKLAEQLRADNIQSELDLLKIKHQKLIYNMEIQQQKYYYLHQSAIYHENLVNYFSKIYQLLLRRLGLPQTSLGMNKFKFESTEPLLKIFEQRIQNIRFEDFEQLKECSLHLMRRQAVHAKLMGNQETVSTLTDLHDINIPLKDLKVLDIPCDFKEPPPPPIETIEQDETINDQELEVFQLDNQVQQSTIPSSSKKMNQLKIQTLPTHIKEEDSEDNQSPQVISLMMKTSMMKSSLNQTDWLDPNRSPQQKDTFTFIPRKKRINFRTADVQTDIQINCGETLTKQQIFSKIIINEMDEYKQIKLQKKPTVAITQSTTPKHQFGELLQTMQQMRTQKHKVNDCFYVHAHRPIRIEGSQSRCKTESSQKPIHYSTANARIIINRKNRSQSKDQ